MSKFDFSVMSNDEISVVCFNKQKWTKEKSLEQAKKELSFIDDYEDNDLEVISSVVQYGFWKSEDGKIYNGWYCPDIYEPCIRELKTQVPVWLVRVKE